MNRAGVWIIRPTLVFRTVWSVEIFSRLAIFACLLFVESITASAAPGVLPRRCHQYGVMGLCREFRYGGTTADEGLRPISPSKLKHPPHPSGRRFQTNQETLFSLVMFI